MEITHSKGTLYPALRLSSFRVRRDSLPPAFELPPEVARAVDEPLPELRSEALAEEALIECQRLLRMDENERRESDEKIAREQALMTEELTRIVEEEERKKSAEIAAKATKVDEVMSLTGLDRMGARLRLEQYGWDYSKIASDFAETVK